MEAAAVPVSLIVAMAENRVIGRDNALPWHLPADLKYFRATTLGKPVIMGRKTFESIGRPLPGRFNVVVSRNPQWRHEGVQVAADADAALALGRRQAAADAAGEVMVIGGAQLYAELLPRAGRIYCTHIHTEVAGDAWFPELEPGAWREVAREDFAAGSAGEPAHSFVVYERLPVSG